MILNLFAVCNHISIRNRWHSQIKTVVGGPILQRPYLKGEVQRNQEEQSRYHPQPWGLREQLQSWKERVMYRGHPERGRAPQRGIQPAQKGGVQGSKHPDLTQLPQLLISKPHRKSEGLCSPFRPRAKDREQGREWKIFHTQYKLLVHSCCYSLKQRLDPHAWMEKSFSSTPWPANSGLLEESTVCRTHI